MVLCKVMSWSVALGLLMMPTSASAQMTPEQCAQLVQMLQQLKVSIQQAEGASSQQQTLKDAFNNYYNVYQQFCQ